VRQRLAVEYLGRHGDRGWVSGVDLS
jgi:hypothetical protein